MSSAGHWAMMGGARRAVVLLFAMSVAFAAINLVFTGREVNQLRQSVLTQCKFDGDLGAAPVASNPATGRPSLLGITIVSDARVAWRGLGCPGQLAAPDPSFARWARYYHLPAS